MFMNRWNSAVLAAATTTALLASAGCKKEEPKKAPEATAAAGDKKADAPAAPAPAPELPDVELVAGDGVVGWLSLASYDATMNAADALAGKLQLTPPGGSVKAIVTENLTTVLAAYGISGTDWLDKTKAIHLGYQDETTPAAPGAEAVPPNPALGTFIVLHVTDKAKAIGAMAAAKKGAEAEGHEAMLDIQGQKVYVDFLGDKTMVLTPKDRFAKVKGFIERLDKITVPGSVYLGVSVEDLTKTRGKEIEQVLGMVESGAAPGMAAQAPGQAQLFAGYAKKLRTMLQDLTRVEIIIGADAELTKVEFRVTAKEGSKTQKYFTSTKGKTPGAIVNLLPASSWLSFAGSVDTAQQIESVEENFAMFKDILKMDEPTYKAFIADVTALAKLEDGTSAMAMYQDGASPIGLLIGAGTSDGPAALALTKKMLAALATKLMADQEAAEKAAGAPAKPEEPMMAIVKKSVAEMKLEPIVTAFGPMLKEKGVLLTLGTAHDGDTNCDTLDVAMDWTKLGQGEEAVKGKALVGDKTALTLCTSKTKLVFAVGPGALEQAKRFSAGKAGGLADAPVYKAATEPVTGAWGIMYANLGVAMNSFKAVFPEVPMLPADRGVVAACRNRAKSWGCELHVPVAVIVAAKAAAMPAPAAVPVAPAPGPLGGATPPPSLVK
jgi:hypothetical protein